MRKRKYLLVLLLVVIANVHAQEAGQHSKRIGLALSGGGALGLAHIGVLKYFEENRIPVHLIAGTSMGGLVAGLYATGHDSGSLRRGERKRGVVGDSGE